MFLNSKLKRKYIKNFLIIIMINITLFMSMYLINIKTKININTATKAELIKKTESKNIGKDKIELIIKNRDKKLYVDWEDFKERNKGTYKNKGIGEKTIKKLQKRFKIEIPIEE